MAFYQQSNIRGKVGIVGRSTSGDGAEVKVDESGAMAVFLSDSVNLDSFGRVRTSNPEFAFDAQFTYDLHPLIYEQITANGGTIEHDTTNRCALMTFSSATNPTAYMQSYEWIRYQPGRSQTYFVTFNFIEAVEGVTKFAGVGDGNNGIELQQVGSTIQIKLSSDTALGDQVVEQKDWNIDKLDGSEGNDNPSGYELDLTKTQILVISYQALYVGRVIVAFDIDGQIIPVHAFKHANNVDHPYLQNASLPIRCGMVGTGTVSTTMNFICSSAISEGGQPEIGGYAFSAEGIASAPNGSDIHLISIRPSALMPASGTITNRSKVILESVELVVTGNFPVRFGMCLGQTISGATDYIPVNSNYSGIEYNTSGTLAGSPAIVENTWYVASAANSKGQFSSRTSNKYPITLNASGGPRDLGTLTVTAAGIGGSSACRAVLNWREVR